MQSSCKENFYRANISHIKMDLIIILDGSDSTGIKDFEKGLKVIRTVMNTIGKLTSDARVKVFQVRI